MNTAAKGARIENKVRDVLAAAGYDVIRSAASKGGADLVAFDDQRMIMVQVKSSEGTISPAERRELRRLAHRALSLPIVAHQVIDPDDARKRIIVFRKLTGQGPKDWQEWTPQ